MQLTIVVSNVDVSVLEANSGPQTHRA